VRKFSLVKMGTDNQYPICLQRHEPSGDFRQLWCSTRANTSLFGPRTGSFKFESNEGDEVGWRDIDDPHEFLFTDQLADRYFKNLVDRFNEVNEQRRRKANSELL
jgi:hypothetical protein